MKEQEKKAIELIRFFWDNFESLSLKECKQCAHKVVDEQLETLNKFSKKLSATSGYWYIQEKESLQQVKEKIESVGDSVIYIDNHC